MESPGCYETDAVRDEAGGKGGMDSLRDDDGAKEKDKVVEC